MHRRAQASLPDPGCITFLAAVDAVVDGEADALSVARAEGHAAGCPGCEQRLRAGRRRRERLRAVGDAERAPATLRAKVTELVRGIRGSLTR